VSAELLFVHGGGDDAYRYDKKIADRLQGLLGASQPLNSPFIEGLETLDWPAVEDELGGELRALSPGAIVIAHSIGAAAVLKLLVGGLDPRLKHLFLLATPYNGADGEWGDSDFAFPPDFAKRLPKGLPITLYHSEDDESIPVASAQRYAEKLPDAMLVILDYGGHQFTGDLTFLATAIRKASQ
jgi:pimeloyl-ACP methyl ester carboxylesterase